MTERGGQADQSIGRRLRLERLVAGKSPAQLAHAVGIDCRSLRDYESGDRRMPAMQLNAAVTALGVPLSLFCYDNDPHRRAEPPDPERGPWYSVPRPLKLLAGPTFSLAHPVLKLWKATRGVMTADLLQAIVGNRVAGRILLLRRSERSSRLTFEHLGPAFSLMRPCETFSLLGREMDALPDPGYGTWMSETYARVASDHQLRLESVLADITTTDPRVGMVRARYDRVLIPWQGRGGDTFVLCLSPLHYRSVISGAA